MDKINEVINLFKNKRLIELENNLKKLGIKKEDCDIIYNDLLNKYYVNLKYNTAIKSDLSRCPVIFNIAHGNFVWLPGNLASMENMPIKIHGNFTVAHNKIMSLSDSPTQYVKGVFNCSGNNLINLRGCPIKNGGVIASFCNLNNLNGSPDQINGDFIVKMNNIKSLVGGPSVVNGTFDISNNKLEKIDIITTGIRKMITHGNPIKEERNSDENKKSEDFTEKIDSESNKKSFEKHDRVVFRKEGSKFNEMRGIITDVSSNESDVEYTVSFSMIDNPTLQKIGKLIKVDPINLFLDTEKRTETKITSSGSEKYVGDAFKAKTILKDDKGICCENGDYIQLLKLSNMMYHCRNMKNGRTFLINDYNLNIFLDLTDVKKNDDIGRISKNNLGEIYIGKVTYYSTKSIDDIYFKQGQTNFKPGERVQLIEIIDKEKAIFKNLETERIFILYLSKVDSYMNMTTVEKIPIENIEKIDKSPYQDILIFGRDGPEFKTGDRVKTIPKYMGMGLKKDNEVLSNRKGVVVNYTDNGLYLICFDDNLKGITTGFNIPEGHGLFIFAKNLIKLNDEGEPEKDASPFENSINYGANGTLFKIKDRVVFIGKETYNDFYGEKGIIVDYNSHNNQYLICFDNNIKRYAGINNIPSGHGYWANSKDIVNIDKFVPEEENKEKSKDSPYKDTIIFGLDGPKFKKGDRVIDKSIYRLNKKGIIVTYNYNTKLYLVCFDENVGGIQYETSHNLPMGHSIYVSEDMLKKIDDEGNIIETTEDVIPDSPHMNTIRFGNFSFNAILLPRDRVLLHDKFSPESLSNIPEKKRYGIIVDYITTEAKYLVCFDEKINYSDVEEWENRLNTFLTRPTLDRCKYYSIPENHGLMISPSFIKFLKPEKKIKEEEVKNKALFNKGDKVMYISVIGSNKIYDGCKGEVVFHNMYEYDKKDPNRYNTFDVNITNKNGHTIRVNYIRPENLRLIGEKYKKDDKVIFIKEDDPLYGMTCSVTNVKKNKYDVAYNSENETKYLEDVDQNDLVRFVKNKDDEVNINDEITYTKPDSKHYGCKGTVVSYDIESDKYKIEIKSKDNRIVKINTKDENLEVILTIKKIKKGDKIRYINNDSAYNGWPGEVEEYDNTNKYKLKLHSKSGMGGEIHITTSPENVVLLDETMDLPELKYGQIVIYNNPSSKYDKLTGEFQGVRMHDKKQIIILDNENKTKLYVDPGTLSLHYGERTTPPKKEPITTTTTTTGKKKKKEKEKPLPPVLVYNRRPVVRKAYVKKEKPKEEKDKDANL